MESTRIILAGLWVAVMLVYLLGDVLRIFAGDFTPGEMGGKKAESWMWMVAALFMLIPVALIVLSLTSPYPAIRWINIAAAVFVVVFNIAGLPYPGAYDNFLIAVSFVLNGVTIWYAWTWT
ncbi:MAG: hypothetical protein QNJ77_15150 [Acidimicrobiia bacterium]|nr:hypothetical protein [Acidimicrobiia bacterium]